MRACGRAPCGRTSAKTLGAPQKFEERYVNELMGGKAPPHIQMWGPVFARTMGVVHPLCLRMETDSLRSGAPKVFASAKIFGKAKNR